MVNVNLETKRHSLAHILAHAVQELEPGTKFGIGPAIENGFYYDFELPEKITEDDFPQIEEKMKELIEQNLKFEQKNISQEKAEELFEEQPYKLELLEDLEGKVSLYRSGEFVDLCNGPHIETTERLNPKAFKLTKVAGAYWKGDEDNKMLTRIYGVAFANQQGLKDYLEFKEQAKKRDHRRLGKKLDLFHIDQEVGPGLILWHPKGALLKKLISDHVLNKYQSHDYQLVSTPHIAKFGLWEKSGHADFYKENMFPAMPMEELNKEEKQDYQLKPMNCPFHVSIYQQDVRSYRDLPLKYTELGTVYRYEKSGVLHGLTRVRGLTQDDAHVFCTPQQMSEELVKLLKLTREVLRDFGFEQYNITLATQPEKYIGTDKRWEKAQNALKYALNELDFDYGIEQQEGAFYGPKIDMNLEDAIGREWQCTTIQLDFNLPERFDMTYMDENGNEQQPIMIHRALLGSLERFIGILIEHYAGEFPTWLAPEQVWVISVGSRHRNYASQVAEKLEQEGIRAEAKNENLTVSKKIRQGEVQKIPYLLVVGDDEQEQHAVRARKESKDLGLFDLEEFIEKIKGEIKNKD
ncbi:threonyl-tRNA synthetase [candidate division MSBL1 archaeon SCGC-AAA382N08]|uniref:Threonine--tRNA ligase n=1 Tax=candidate division MSBL1 archaeon SCGC-AAA382N08 TaxID=1698285 RepID=A0A133VQW4_9EURY|nr:threonyl-tRNA synthetase [candidate division MSBL1 archaeon SCGC-AAA382N08]